VEPHILRLRAAIALLLFAAASAPRASAWGPTGHRAVGRIAERHLTPEAAQAVRDLIAPEQLAYVTTWADDIRSEADWAKAEDWHWVTLPDGISYGATQKNPNGDLLEAIARFQGVLADRAAPHAERAEALKWLAHLLGDLHQPLHVGRGDDRGGNEVLVLWMGEPSNLHSVWDSKLIALTELSFSELAELLDHPTPAEVREWQAGGPRDWAAESQRIRNECYELGDRRLSYRYAHAHWPTVERRLLEAGVRLAGELNRLLGSR
jgi:nuclease S1